MAAEPVITAAHIADIIGARFIHVPLRLLRAAAAASWRLRLQKIDPNWLDLAYNLPVLNTARAQIDLEWRPAKDAISVMKELIDGIARSHHGVGPVLRPRTVLGEVQAVLTHGPISSRRLT
ncbi:MAG: hypothetical protein ACRCTR_06180 [Actinomycetota bacterium]